jgi:hypothetical protein
MRLVGFAFLVLTAGTQVMYAVSAGDSIDDLRNELGPPNGMVEIGPNAVWFYDRGEVALTDGRVSNINLMTADELVAHREREARRTALLLEMAAARRIQNEAEGRALKQSKVDSPGFQSLPASERVSFWRHFKLKYPTVPIDLELTAALTQSRIDQAAAEKAAQDLYWKQAASTRTTRNRSYSWFPWFGISYGHGHGHRPGKPVHPIYPGHPGRPPDCKDEPNPDYQSKKGSIMASADRTRGRIDSGYARSRSRIYSSITR